ncbi:gamma-glutamyl hydrolase-like [Saccoglossus kowalevskii]|uniref:folate gamma-glutamyl hydrolase n=1 Tax=Saccoglossus kowalevskii TaxID=10224 RepID=A0ABM0GZB8_SACKO|nr:PREDICTED: gamma-glutamyl hydrolase-like [Saccoglossus kowalevskii]
MMISTAQLGFLYFSVLGALVAGIATNNRPIIGVLAQTSYDHLLDYGPSYVAASYVKFLESGGARVVPIAVNQSLEYYEHLLHSINGVLLPGGDQAFDTSTYSKSAKIIMNLAMKANDNGDYFPMWGTCLGHEWMIFDIAEKFVFMDTNSTNVNFKLKFASDFQTSRLFNSAPERLVKIMANKAVSFNYHETSLTIKNYTKDEKLTKFFRILTTSLDENGMEFVSTMEAYRYPFYGVQWHPEKNNFEWMLEQYINHSEEAVLVTQYLANFFVQEARKSAHKFSSQSEELAALTYSYTPVYTGSNTNFQQCYFLKE